MEASSKEPSFRFLGTFFEFLGTVLWLLGTTLSVVPRNLFLGFLGTMVLVPSGGS